MDTEAIILKLLTAGVLPLLLDGRLVVKEESMKGVSETVLAILTMNREEIKSLLQQREQQEVKPYVDEHYNMGLGGKGCLVVPMNCGERYKYWKPTFSCLSVECDEWLKESSGLKEAGKLKWKPLALAAILKELNASEDLKKRYCPTM